MPDGGGRIRSGHAGGDGVAQVTINVFLPALACLVLGTWQACHAFDPVREQDPKGTVQMYDDAEGYWKIEANDGRVCWLGLRSDPRGSDRNLNVDHCKISSLSAVRAWRVDSNQILLLTEAGAVCANFRMIGPDELISLDGNYRGNRVPVS